MILSSSRTIWTAYGVLECFMAPTVPAYLYIDHHLGSRTRLTAFRTTSCVIQLLPAFVVFDIVPVFSPEDPDHCLVALPRLDCLRELSLISSLHSFYRFQSRYLGLFWAVGDHRAQQTLTTSQQSFSHPILLLSPRCMFSQQELFG